MGRQNILIGEVPAIIWGEPSGRLFLYIHGQGGNKEEAAAFSDIACQRGFQVLSIDLPEHGQRKAAADTFDPWHAVPELKMVMAYAKKHWQNISLLANSIGAWFSMLSWGNESLEQCLFVSPVVDMKRLVSKMMEWANVSEARLQRELVIPTDFGQTLSWKYWTYILEHPIMKWECPTWILYGDKDHLVDRDSVECFSQKFQCELTIVENGEHWFHTETQLNVLADWVKSNIPIHSGKGERKLE